MKFVVDFIIKTLLYLWINCHTIGKHGESRGRGLVSGKEKSLAVSDDFRRCHSYEKVRNVLLKGIIISISK